MGHTLRLNYSAYIPCNLYHPQQSINLDSINFRWDRENGLLTPANFYERLPGEYAVIKSFKKRCNGRCKCRGMEAECSKFCACGNT